MSEANMSLGLSQSLRSLVSNKFSHAQTSKSLIFSNTQLCILHNKTGVPFQLRYCPALSQKPVDNKQSSQSTQSQNIESAAPKKKFDPFENPSDDLLVTRIPNSDDYTHNLVLNKFPVIPNHFILATRRNDPQTHLLEERDLYFTYTCTQAWQDDKRRNLYGFFNTGEYSGASQPHRHLQFLPVEDMKGSASESDSDWDLLCDRMTTPINKTLSLLYDPGLPIIHLATPLSASTTSSQLYEKYHLLLRATTVLLSYKNKILNPASISQLLTPSTLGSATITNDTGRTTFSHNIAITTTVMAILPRRAEDGIISDLANSESGTGTVSINGTILAGTLMVKNQDEWDVLKAKPEILDTMLMQVGFPWSGHDTSRI